MRDRPIIIKEVFGSEEGNKAVNITVYDRAKGRVIFAGVLSTKIHIYVHCKS